MPIDKETGSSELSIIIPVYNVEEFLPACLSSLAPLANTCELIFVDDASNDASLALLEDFAKSNRAKIIRNAKNYGLFHARLIGDMHATSKYLTYLDSDDAYANIKALMRALSILKSDAKLGFVEFLYYNTDRVEEIVDGANPERIVRESERKLEVAEEYKIDLNLMHPSWTIWNKIYPRELVLRADGILEDLVKERLNNCEDVLKTYLICALLKQQGAYCYRTKERVIAYRQNIDSLSRTSDVKARRIRGREHTKVMLMILWLRRRYALHPDLCAHYVSGLSCTAWHDSGGTRAQLSDIMQACPSEVSVASRLYALFYMAKCYKDLKINGMRVRASLAKKFIKRLLGR